MFGVIAVEVGVLTTGIKVLLKEPRVGVVAHACNPSAQEEEAGS